MSTPSAAVGREAHAPTTTHRKKKSYLAANVATVLAIAIAAAASWITAMRFVETYGLGATHLGQLADPAKRPVPGLELYLLDGVAFVLVVVLARIAARGFRAGRLT